ncbi:hypothetical protein SISSUDRAFT_1058300 [Sistotremastrum suecicum HHB10207 ss-3]|uniref:Histone deacetylase complex subunit SAP30 Sin3 binding domain-containing protein n=1 Tax=Sistotremastrum suecicum HHB10207 ss-3 TaxID=1314776 RepID=A0A166HL98_9AGAM|nr:hypothetical protein SISSUDRAFT_1058300 [Sistotremastrum suecicum HHB10207 ss-3]
MAPPITAPGSRSRQNTRKKTDDDSAYIGASGLGKKRAAPDGNEPRMKRKRIESAGLVPPQGTVGIGETRNPLMDFSALPTAALHRYLITWDLVPFMDPGPTSLDAPPLPSSLLTAPTMHTRITGQSSSTTPANRPRRTPASANRRSSRLSEEDERQTRQAPVLADVQAIPGVLAALAQRHFMNKQPPVKEGEIVMEFLYATRTRGGNNT